MVHRLPRPGDHQGVPGAGGQVRAPPEARGARRSGLRAKGQRRSRRGLAGARVSVVQKQAALQLGLCDTSPGKKPISPCPGSRTTMGSFS